MIFYDSIHETCITVPCENNVQEGQLCMFDTSYGVRRAESGECPDGLVKYVRNGKATVQIHGLITVPYNSEDYAVGKLCLSADDSSCGMQMAAAGEKYLVVNVDTANHTITLMLG